MSLNIALKNAYIADLEKSIETHKSFQLGNFKSEYETQKAFGMIQAFEAALSHFKTLFDRFDSIPQTEPPQTATSDAEIEIITPE